MRPALIVLFALVLAAPVFAGDNPNARIFLEFENDSNYIEPEIFSLFDATIYLENLGPDGGVYAVAFKLNATPDILFSSITPRSGGLVVGDETEGWAISYPACLHPDGNGRVALADISYIYMDIPGTLEIVPNDYNTTEVVDCSMETDHWCVRLEPSGNGGVWAPPPPGNCPLSYENWLVPSEAPTIQAGIDSAGAGDTVTVAANTYYEHDLLMKSGIVLRGETGLPEDVVIDADSLGRVFSIPDTTDSMWIRHVTITGGYVTDDYLAEGGGIYCEGNLILENCVIAGNAAHGSSVGAHGVSAHGGGIAFDSCTPHLIRCLITGNTAVAEAAPGQYASAYGGGIHTNNCQPFLTECTISHNDLIHTAPGDGRGGGIWCGNTSMLVQNSIIAFSGHGEAVRCSECDATLLCSDVFGNAGGDWVGCLASMDSIDGNFRADPNFCWDLNPDQRYTLQDTSACAHDTCGAIGARPVGCAYVITWNGGGDGYSWWDPDNWDLDRVPEADDDVRITSPDAPWVEFYGGGSATVRRLTLIGPGSYSRLEIYSDTLAITEGAQSDTAIIMIHENAALGLGPGCVFTNGPIARLDLLGGDLVGEGRFVNGGRVRKQDPEKSRAISTVTVEFDNEMGDPGDGAIEVEQGTLVFESEFTSAGSTYVYAGAEMQLDPGEGPLRADSLSNSGVIVLYDGSVLAINGPQAVFTNEAIGEIQLLGGDVVGTGALHNYGLVRKAETYPLSRSASRLAVDFENLPGDPGDGAVTVDEGTLVVEDEFANAGSLSVNGAAEMQLDPGEGPFRADFFTNTNVVVIGSGAVLSILDSATVFKNAPAGLVKLQGTGEILGAGSLHNYGSFLKEDPMKDRALGHIAVEFENVGDDPGDGALTIQDGVLWMEGEVANSGSIIVHDAAEMLLDPGDGPFHEGKSAAGGARSRAAATNLVGGSWEILGTVRLDTVAAFTNQGLVRLDSSGVFDNDGTFGHEENAVLAGSGTFDNTGGSFTGAGAIRPGGSVGTLSFLGDFVQTATSEIEVEIGGTAPGTGHDVFAITGAAALDGALYVTLVDDFEPVEGDSFALITIGGMKGTRTDFDCFSGLQTPGGHYLEPVQEADLFSLVARDTLTGNAAPVAAADFDSTDASTPIVVDVLANDADADLDPLRIASLHTAGTIGAVSILPGDTLVRFVPALLFTGRTSFSYSVTDCEGGVDTATVTIGVARRPRTWRVPGDAPSIAEGLLLAAAKDTVEIECGTYHESGLVMKPGVALRSETGSFDCVTIDADSLGPCLTGAGLESTTAVVGITFTGGLSPGGGGVVFTDADPLIRRCRFIGNVSTTYGGGLRINGGDPLVSSCVFAENRAPSGAGVALFDSDAIVESCLVVGNVGSVSSAGIRTAGGNPSIRRTTFAENTLTSGFGVCLYVVGGIASLENVLLASNVGNAPVYCTAAGDVTLACSDVYGNSGGDYVHCLFGMNGVDGNFSGDPLFCRWNAPEPYSLDAASPCAPLNQPSCGLVGAFGVGCTVTGAEGGESAPAPLAYKLHANRPNPFNPATTIRFDLPKAGRAMLAVYDVAGRRVALLADGSFAAGSFERVWDGKDGAGRTAGSGVYFARFVAGDFTAVRKMVMLR
ncbi:MAG: right-handed parallel beta-helix repeat-containing protein [Candidatus Eisenbacteria bacterium]